MDATVDQQNAYRFIYLLPYGPSKLLVEDTRYTHDAQIDEAMFRATIAAYVAGQGWEIDTIESEERGALPIVLDGDIDAFWRTHQSPAPVGLRAALFHPTTGYSLLDALHTADAIATLPTLTTATIRSSVEARSRRDWTERGFYRMVNRMLFLAAQPNARYRILQRFYRLPQPLIERFYAARTTPSDMMRILCGKPPVSLSSAVKAIIKRGPAHE